MLDYMTAAEILEEVMATGYLEDGQMEAMEVAIELLQEKAGEEDDLR